MTAAVLATPNYSIPQSPAQEFSDLSSEDEAGENHACDHRKRYNPRDCLLIAIMFCRAAALQSYAVATAEARTATQNVAGVARAWRSQRGFSGTLTGKQVLIPEEALPTQQPVHKIDMLPLQALVRSEYLVLCHMFVSGVQVITSRFDVTKSDCTYVTVVFHVGVGL